YSPFDQTLVGQGGGVYNAFDANSNTAAEFTLVGGSIAGNSAGWQTDPALGSYGYSFGQGGGVYNAGLLTMRGGDLTGNAAGPRYDETTSWLYSDGFGQGGG